MIICIIIPAEFFILAKKWSAFCQHLELITYYLWFFLRLFSQSVPGVIEMIKVITRKKSERIAKFAFDFAMKNGRKKVTCVHKANIM